MSTVHALQTPKNTSYDVVIVGGAMFGASIAWFLANNPDFDGSVLVVERDPSYEFASTTHTHSCMRQQFSQAINIHISQFAAEFVKNFQVFMGEDTRVPSLAFKNFGYLYLADSEKSAQSLYKSYQLQNACGAGTQHISASDIARAYPFYQLDDIVAANLNLVDEGYFEASTMFQWFKRLSQEKGVEYVHNEVCALSLNTAASEVESVNLQSGDVITCGRVVNASGPRAAATAGMAGIEIPVEPRKRYSFLFAAEKPLGGELPLTVDPSGVHVLAEGAYYLAGCAADEDPAADYNDFLSDHSLWEEKVWPAIANRIPQFDALKLINSWVGHYAYNTFDQNAILGAHSQVSNFFFANGFSGHGIQQAPAVGRGLAELISYGEYRSLDLSPLHIDRLQQRKSLTEEAVI